jgi:deoxyhypusine synthase
MVMNKSSVSDLANAIAKDLEYTEEVRGNDFENDDMTIDDLIDSYSNMGIQGTNLHKAIVEIRRMREAKAKIFFGCTSNMMSCGVREQIKFLAKNRHIDILVCTGGGIEEETMDGTE